MCEPFRRNLDDDSWLCGTNRTRGTLFKRRTAAELIQRKLGRGNEVIEVKKVRGKVIGAPRRRPKTRGLAPTRTVESRSAVRRGTRR